MNEMYDIDGMFIKKLRRVNPNSTYSYTSSIDTSDPPLTTFLIPTYQCRPSFNLSLQNRPRYNFSSYSKPTYQAHPPNIDQQHLNKNILVR